MYPLESAAPLLCPRGCPNCCYVISGSIAFVRRIFAYPQVELDWSIVHAEFPFRDFPGSRARSAHRYNQQQELLGLDLEPSNTSTSHIVNLEEEQMLNMPLQWVDASIRRRGSVIALLLLCVVASATFMGRCHQQHQHDCLRHPSPVGGRLSAVPGILCQTSLWQCRDCAR
eukprot:scaffold71359_cov43-Cyclotella_meneghiniana.AAC.3